MSPPILQEEHKKEEKVQSEEGYGKGTRNGAGAALDNLSSDEDLDERPIGSRRKEKPGGDQKTQENGKAVESVYHKPGLIVIKGRRQVPPKAATTVLDLTKRVSENGTTIRCGKICQDSPNLTEVFMCLLGKSQVRR
jgi:hypothetical protein